ncbi:long-chain fatty acid--CoA ligase [Mesobacillus maritimus]|uniref:long-chain-fatty-acid--CoA ligase n=1 Tax=Mesobacillus maritimus TaxID=1643336 RepID=UPI00203DFE4A|nr:long-chain fatty acid--CoA ligase [Mesobacillus maritimus]MCM3588820.1 long-chain fatty acid--CoA ligase [Mesobacillus maritimus]
MTNKRWLRFYPKEVNPNIEIEKRSLTDLLSDAVKQFRNDISLEYYEKQWSYQEVQEQSEKLSACLYQQGFRKGDRLSLMMPNCPQYIFSFFAVVRIGGIIVQTNPMYVERELEYQLNDTNSEFMICSDSVYERVKRIQEKTTLKKIIVVPTAEYRNLTLVADDVWFDDFLETYKSDAPKIEIAPSEDIAVLQYTGGTTGVSKGVMLTHQNFINQVEQINEFLFKRFERVENLDRVVISFLPFFHIFGLANVTLTGFRFGYKQIILPRFDVETVLNLIKKDPPLFFFGVPTMYNALMNAPQVETYGIDKIKAFFCGGSPMPLEKYQKFKQLMGEDAVLADGYGLSEATSGTTNQPYSRVKIGSVGVPLPRTDAKIVVETDKGFEEAPTGSKGELIIKGPQVMKGYWNKTEETNAALRNGWLHTGDIAYMDEEGYLYIVDRKKDMIIASGYNIYPREIEEVIYQISAVREVVVIGIPDEYRGETVKAYIALKEYQAVSKNEIIAFCRKNLATYKVPKQIEFREELPKSSVGKLLKRELRNQEWNKHQIK